MRGSRLQSICRLLIAALIVTLVVAHTGCHEEAQERDGGGAPEAASSSALTSSSTGWVARLNGKEIGAEALDGPLRLDLYDLELAAYQLRIERLTELVENRFGVLGEGGLTDTPPGLEINLRKPLPPRLDLPKGAIVLLGPASASVVVTHFIDFASPHSRRVQPDLIRLVDAYGSHVRIETRLLPLPYHRHAEAAAIAARCAESEGRYRAYHDLLLLEQPALGATALREYAERVGIDLMGFDDCLGSDAAAAQNNQDLVVARRFGVRRAATLFVNGLYMSGRPGFAALDAVVANELKRLGVDARPGPQGDASASGVLDEAKPEKRQSSLPKIPPDALSEPGLIVELSRIDIDEALEDRRQLNRRLEASRGEYSGHRLLQIRDVRDGDLYSRLGLEVGDVLLALNGEFVTVEENRIFETLAEQSVVRLLVMRRGKPHSFEYRFR